MFKDSSRGEGGLGEPPQPSPASPFSKRTTCKRSRGPEFPLCSPPPAYSKVHATLVKEKLGPWAEPKHRGTPAPHRLRSFLLLWYRAWKEGWRKIARPYTRAHAKTCAPFDRFFVCVCFAGGARGGNPLESTRSAEFFDVTPASLDMAREMVMSHEIDI